MRNAWSYAEMANLAGVPRNTMRTWIARGIVRTICDESPQPNGLARTFGAATVASAMAVAEMIRRGYRPSAASRFVYGKRGVDF